MSRSWRHGYAEQQRPWWQRAWGCGREWWGARPLSMHLPSKRYNKWFKRRLHKMERQYGKKVLHQEVNDG